MIAQLQPSTAAFLGFNQVYRPHNKSFALMNGSEQAEIRNACLDYLQTLPKSQQTGKTVMDYADLHLGTDILKNTADSWAHKINPDSRPRAKKLSDKDIIDICKLLLNGNGCRQIARLFKVSEARITQIKTGRYRKDLTEPLIGDYYHIKGRFEVKQ